jgi:hypothetical protein
LIGGSNFARHPFVDDDTAEAQTVAEVLSLEAMKKVGYIDQQFEKTAAVASVKDPIILFVVLCIRGFIFCRRLKFD